MTQKKDDSMISLVMLHLMVEPAVQVQADSIFPAWILAICLVIFLVTSSAAVRRRGASNGPMKGANLRTSVRITFEEAVFGCEKEIDMVLKDEPVLPVAEPEQNLELLRRPVQNAVEKVKLYFPSNLCSAWFRMFRPVRNVTDPAKLSKIDVLHAAELVILPAERRSKCLFLPESDNGRVSASVKKVSRVSMADRVAICW